MASTDQLFGAIDTDDAALVAQLLSTDPSLAGSRDAQGVSALMRARYRGPGAVLEGLLAADPALDVHDAAALGRVERLGELLAADPTLARSRSADGFPPLHLAAFFGETDAATLLLDAGAEVDARATGWMTGTALHSASAGRHGDIVDLLLARGADPNAAQAGGFVPVHAAALNGDERSTRALLAAGADPRARADDGRDVEAMAVEGGDPKVVAAIDASLNRL
jgi:ankyrin repeat protein